jgi:predicted transcriptional regulator
MNVSLSPKTQKLLKQQMKKSGSSNPDDLLRIALQTLDAVRGEDYEDLDPATRAAIEAGEAQYQRGEYRPWGQVRKELGARFVRK